MKLFLYGSGCEAMAPFVWWWSLMWLALLGKHCMLCKVCGEQDAVSTYANILPKSPLDIIETCFPCSVCPLIFPSKAYCRMPTRSRCMYQLYHPQDQVRCMYHPLDQVRVRNMNNDVATHVRSVPTLLPWHQTSWELLIPLSFKDNIIIPHHPITYFCHFQFPTSSFPTTFTFWGIAPCWRQRIAFLVGWLQSNLLSQPRLSLGWWSSWGL